MLQNVKIAKDSKGFDPKSYFVGPPSSRTEELVECSKFANPCLITHNSFVGLCYVADVACVRVRIIVWNQEIVVTSSNPNILDTVKSFPEVTLFSDLEMEEISFYPHGLKIYASCLEFVLKAEGKKPDNWKKRAHGFSRVCVSFAEGQDHLGHEIDDPDHSDMYAQWCAYKSIHEIKHKIWLHDVDLVSHCRVTRRGPTKRRTLSNLPVNRQVSYGDVDISIGRTLFIVECTMDPFKDYVRVITEAWRDMAHLEGRAHLADDVVADILKQMTENDKLVARRRNTLARMHSLCDNYDVRGCVMVDPALVLDAATGKRAPIPPPMIYPAKTDWHFALRGDRPSVLNTDSEPLTNAVEGVNVTREEKHVTVADPGPISPAQELKRLLAMPEHWKKQPWVAARIQRLLSSDS